MASAAGARSLKGKRAPASVHRSGAPVPLEAAELLSGMSQEQPLVAVEGVARHAEIIGKSEPERNPFSSVRLALLVPGARWCRFGFSSGVGVGSHEYELGEIDVLF